MTFARPEMLWLLAVTVPLLTWFLWWTWRKKQSLIREFVQSRLLAQLTVGVSAQRQKLRLILLVAAAALILLALARPLYGFAWEEVRQRGLDILVAIDTSRSMLATDVSPNRLTRAKLAALDLMRAARSDRLGLIAFAGTAFLQCPLTLDDNAFSESVNFLDVNVIPQGGTALAEAIETALAAFKESGDNYKVLVIITDGEDHEAGVTEAAEKAATAGVRIYPVGVGTLEGERLRVVDDSGKTTYLNDADGKPVLSKLNMTLLQQIATTTKGDFLKLGGADPMKLLYDVRLGPLPRGDNASRLFRQYYERFQWPLGFAILLLVVELFVSERRRVPRTEAILHAANPELRKAVSFLVALMLPVVAQASASQAQRAYEAGRFPEAQREYQRLLEKKPNEPRLHYNAGTAAYRAGRFDQATNELNAAVLASDPQLLARAYYNLGNALYRAGQKAANPGDALEPWKQAVQSYENSLKLNPQDGDAKFNRQFVAQRIEELQKQQPPPQQDQNQKQEPQDKQDQKDQSNQDQQQQQQQQQPQSKPDSQKKSDKDQQKQQQQQPEPNKEPPQPQQRPPEPKPDPAKRPAAEPKPKPGDTGAAEPKARNEQKPDAKDAAAEMAGVPPGQMTPQQARQLLEAARAEERPWNFVPPEARRERAGYRKEW